MLRIAVIFESSPFDRKGLFNAVHNRIKHLSGTGECHVDAFCIHSWDTDFTRRVRHTPEVAERVEHVDYDGVTYRMLWYGFSIVDHVMVEKLRCRPLFFRRAVESWLPLLEGYDCISAHSFAGGIVARAASERFGVPYYVSWHGSDIHTHPIRNSLLFRETAEVMKGASCNFFVSEALRKASERIAGPDSPEGSVRKEVLYNGVSDEFFMFPNHCRKELRGNNGIADNEKVVAFVGSLVAVKNVSVLQPLFHEISRLYSETCAGPDVPSVLKFWIVGDGKLGASVQAAMVSDSSIDVSFWGNVPSEHMPSVMNCVDVLVLPSLNEGLPLVCAEAIRCGANVVGSDVGGIPEVIGGDFVVPLDADFVSNMASKVVQLLLSPAEQPLPESLNWTTTAQKEFNVLSSSC